MHERSVASAAIATSATFADLAAVITAVFFAPAPDAKGEVRAFVRAAVLPPRIGLRQALAEQEDEHDPEHEEAGDDHAAQRPHVGRVETTHGIDQDSAQNEAGRQRSDARIEHMGEHRRLRTSFDLRHALAEMVGEGSAGSEDYGACRQLDRHFDVSATAILNRLW